MAMMIETGHLFPSRPPSITALPRDPHPHPQQFLSSSSQYESVMIGGGSGGVSIPAVLPPRGVAGPSQWWLQSPGRSAVGRAERYPFAGQSRVLAQAEARYAYADDAARRPPPRRRGHHTPVFAKESVINDNGAFNGSCVSTELQSSPLHTIEGTCASYYPDITAYCCSGIGGNLTTIPWGIQGEESIAAAASSASASGSAASSSTTTSAASMSPTAADEEPLCQTTDYNDALACFKLTAETNCKNGQSGLYGLCNSMGTDTSTVTAASSTSGSASLISAASTSGGVAVERGPPWKRQWVRGVVAVATAVVLVVGV